MDRGVFFWRVMRFGMKNGPPTFQRIVTKTFKEYINNFMKTFLDDFIVYTVTLRLT
jgi:hypothetical protein